MLYPLKLLDCEGAEPTGEGNPNCDAPFHHLPCPRIKAEDIEGQEDNDGELKGQIRLALQLC